jgi:small subunit ribosomal protein S14
MATTAKEAKHRETVEALSRAKAAGKKVDMLAVRHRNRCLRCGRPRGYMRKFQLCRLCFRQLSLAGEVPGVTKSSW